MQSEERLVSRTKCSTTPDPIISLSAFYPHLSTLNRAMKTLGSTLQEHRGIAHDLMLCDYSVPWSQD